MEDWRLTGQESYLTGEKLKIITPNVYFKNNELKHEHCEFCMKKINVETKEKCYATLDDYRWICKNCFRDFKIKFKWICVNELKE